MIPTWRPDVRGRPWLDVRRQRGESASVAHRTQSAGSAQGRGMVGRGRTGKIERLTDEEAQAFEQWRRRWRDVALSTQPVDRPRAESAITALYRRIGEE